VKALGKELVTRHEVPGTGQFITVPIHLTMSNLGANHTIPMNRSVPFLSRFMAWGFCLFFLPTLFSLLLVHRCGNKLVVSIICKLFEFSDVSLYSIIFHLVQIY